MNKLIAAFIISGLFATAVIAQNPVTGKVIVLDPRYSFKEGTVGNDYASEVFEKLKNLLTDKGYNVFLTTDKFKPASMEERMRFAKEHAAEFYVSLSFYNVDQTKYGRKRKEVAENYMIYPVVSKNGDHADFIKAKDVSLVLQSRIYGNRAVQPRVFNNAFVYDIPGNGLHVSISYKLNTPFVSKLASAEYQQSLAEAMAATVENGL